MTTVWLVVVFVIAIIISVPIGVAMGLACLTPSLVDPAFSASVEFVARSGFGAINSTVVLAIPLFMLSGAIMTHGGLAKRLFDIFALVVGRLPGGMPSAVIITCLFYGAISGSGAATAAAIGAMCIPILVDLGYDKTFCGSIVAAAGGLGIIIPPSVPFIMFSLVTSVPVSDLFLAGIIPGCLIALIMIIYSIIRCRNREDKEKINKMNQELKRRGAWKVLKDGFWALMTPVIILGGIYSGAVAPTEAACISVVYAVIICTFVYKSINLKSLIQIIKSAAKSFAPIGIMLAFAMALMKVITILDIPAIIGNFIASSFDSRILFLLLLNLVLLLLGMVIDVGPAILIIAPIIMPVALSFGIDPVHLGVIMTVNLAVGLVSPPFGMTLFVTAPLADSTPVILGRKAIPYILCLFLALMIITFVPALSLLPVS
jgi:C4-dicarboxylate transporter DctM subunit